MSDIWITTKGGDKGETSIGSGKRIPKDHPRVETYGTLDECQAHIGMARSLCEYPEICDVLCSLEQELGRLMGHIALFPGLDCPDIGELEKITALHVARTVATRAERVAVGIYRTGDLAEDAYRYINRLSDVIYALSLWYDHLEREKKGAPKACM